MAGPALSLDQRGLPPGYPFKPTHEITPREAQERARRGELLIVDVRTAEEVSVARIAGSLHIPLHELEARMDDVENALDATATARAAFLCHHGVRSMKAAILAREHGIVEARSIAGGIELWSLAADPSVPRYERGPAGCRRV